MKKYILLFLTLSFLLISTGNVLAEDNLTENYDEKITGIGSMTFFQDLPGTFYVYFGRPTCLECVDFEKHLQIFLQENNRIVYYCNTAYWKDDAQYDNVLRKYKIDSVPMLVKIKNSEFSAAYEFNSSASEVEIQEELHNFFEKENLEGFPVTAANNFPIQFDTNLHTFTFLIMGFTILYLIIRKNEIIQKRLTSVLIIIFLNSTLLFALHLAIAGFGFNFAIHYNAAPDQRFWARIGTMTWLTVTPLLYFAVLVICVYLQCKVKRIDSQK